MNQTTLTRNLIATGAVALFAGASAQALDIDTFEDIVSQIVASESPGAPPTTSTVNVPFAIGGERELTASLGTGDLGTLGMVDEGVLQFANSPSSSGSLLLAYGGNGSFGPGIDFTADGSTGLIFTLLFADAPVDYEISMGNTLTSPATGTLPFDFVGPLDVFIPFTDFAGAGDFSEVTSIDILLTPSNGVKGADLTIGKIATGVPEPSSLALIALGGLAMMRRRR